MRLDPAGQTVPVVIAGKRVALLRRQPRPGRPAFEQRAKRRMAPRIEPHPRTLQESTQRLAGQREVGAADVERHAAPFGRLDLYRRYRAARKHQPQLRGRMTKQPAQHIERMDVAQPVDIVENKQQRLVARVYLFGERIGEFRRQRRFRSVIRTRIAAR